MISRWLLVFFYSELKKKKLNYTKKKINMELKARLTCLGIKDSWAINRHGWLQATQRHQFNSNFLVVQVFGLG